MPGLPMAAIDFGDLLELAPLLLPIGLWALSRLAAVVRGMNNAPARPRQPPPDLVRELRRGPAPGRGAPPAPAAGRRPVPPAGGGERPDEADPALELARQIEEFIARGRGTTARRPPAPKPAAARPPAVSGGAPRQAERTSQRPQQRPAGGASPPAPATPTKTLGRLPSDVTLPAEKTFRQEPRALTPTDPAAPTVAVAPQHPVVAELVAAVRDPRALQRMILVREILDRPVDRW